MMTMPVFNIIEVVLLCLIYFEAALIIMVNRHIRFVNRMTKILDGEIEL